MKSSLEGREALLVAENTLLRQFFDQAPLSYQSLDENGSFLSVNQAWLDALGYRLEEVIGKNFGDLPINSIRLAPQSGRV